jgi:geranyl-CoA carboxylase alpha subunit
MSARLQCNGHRQVFHYQAVEPGELEISLNGQNFLLHNLLAFPPAEEQQIGNGQVTSPMHGAVQEVFESKGEQVEKGQTLLIIEATKMQHEIFAQVDGIVQSVNVEKGA